MSVFTAAGQSDGDFRTASSGSLNWNATSSWEYYSSGSWGAASEYPGQSAGAGEVTIQAGATVTLNVNPPNAIGNLIVDGDFQTSNNNRPFTIGGNLIVNGDFNIRRCNPLTVTGNTVVNGTLRDNNNNGSAVFQGDFTVNVGGDFSTANNSAFTFGGLVIIDQSFSITGSGSLIFQGGITNNGTFTKTSMANVTFSGNSQVIGGANAFTITTNNLIITDDIQVDVTGDVDFIVKRDFDNYSNAAIAFNATNGSITFDRTNNQNINDQAGTGTVTFNDLIIGGAGTKYLMKDINVTNDLTVDAATFDLYRAVATVGGNAIINANIRASNNATAGLNVTGSLDVNSGASFNAERATVSIDGPVTIDGSYRDSNSNGTVTFNNDLVISASGSFNNEQSALSVAGATTVSGAMTDNQNNGSNTFLGLFTVNTGASYTTANTSAHTFGNSIVNNGTLTINAGGVTIDFINNSQTISGSNPVTLDGTMTIADGLSLTNQLTDLTDGLILEGSLNGATAASSFVNEQLVSVRGTNGPMLTTGVLDASANGNTVRYDMNETQYLTPVSYYDIIIQATGDQDKFLQGATVVSNDFILTNRADLFPVEHDLTVVGQSNIFGRIYDQDATGTCDFQNVDLSNGQLTGSVAGNYVINGNLTMPSAYGRIGVGNVTVQGTTTVDAGSNLTINSNAGTKTFVGAITCNGDWLNTGNESVEIRNGLEFNGTTFTSGNGSYTFTSNDQSITGTSAMRFTRSIVVGAGITLSNDNTNPAGLRLDFALVGNDATSTFDNNGYVDYYSGTEPMLNAILDCSTTPNTFNYNLAGNQNIKGAVYDVLQLSNTSRKRFYGTVEVVSSFETSGTVNVECNAQDLILGGSHSLASSGTFLTGINTVTYNGAGDQDLINITYSGNLAVAGNGIKSLTAPLSVVSDIDVLGATLNLNAQTLTPGGNVTIANGATLEINDNASLQLADAAVLTNNGILKVVGTSGNPATITTSGTGGYQISQSDASAEFHALYAVFDATGGITLTDGTVDATNNFGYSTFSNGTGQEYLQLTNFEPIGGLSSVQSAVFEAGPTYNVSRTAGPSTVEFVQATGALAGENFDNDNGNPGTLIEWTDPTNVFYSTGNVSAGLTASWTRNRDGSGGNPSDLNDGTAMLVVQDGHTVTLDSNGDINVRKLTIGDGGTNTYFIIGADATVQNLTIQELLDIEAQGQLSVGSNASHNLHLYGNLINNGIVNLQSSYTSVVNTHLYGTMEISGSATPKFNDVVFEAGCNALTRKIHCADIENGCKVLS